ncbi:unnamed protein product [Triticum turgidum subsp. durum]|uniref:Gamma carbonic anhydrase n=1 Tax=Triticum turgidum subsp. durum TaxID=4567 RepID=A0A9R1BJ52_TRITD|nr:unnamed protein product [Triticum turgidum subsp. durum]
MAKAFYAVGFWIRETGQALDRLGCRLQGNYFFHEQIPDQAHEFVFPLHVTLCRWIKCVSIFSRHRTLMNIFDKAPHVHKEAFVAPSASLIGDVQVGQGSSIWYGCVLRGDANNVQVGSGTNIQDNSVVHVAKSNLTGKVFPTIIGDNVTVGHSAVLQGCTVEDEAFVGMGATLLDGVIVEKHGMVAAGALVWGGNPAKFLRKLTDEEIAFIAESAANYSNLAKAHAVENAKPLEKIDFEKVLRKKVAHQDEEDDSMLSGTRVVPPELAPPSSTPAQ